MALLMICHIHQSLAQDIVLSEIMSDPKTGGSDNEFLELYNTSGNSWFSLSGLTLEGTSASAIEILEWDSRGYELKPGHFAVILPPGYFESGHEQIYNTLIPPEALILKAEKALSLNNGGDQVVIKNASGHTMIDFTYPGNGPKGYSLEKINLTGGDLLPNYATSLSENGSPGLRNSVTPYQNDLGISLSDTLVAAPKSTALIEPGIQNSGLNIFGNGATINLYWDKNTDSLTAPEELVSTYTLSENLVPGSSIKVPFYFTLTEERTADLILTLSHPEDENPKNNTSIGTLFFGTTPQSIVINEILYAPVQNPDDFIQDQPDFIELLNTGRSPIDLRGWTLRDAASETGKQNTYPLTRSTKSVMLEPGAYAVFSPETHPNPDSTRLVLFYPYLTQTETLLLYDATRSTFSLNNDGDQVILKDAFGVTVDSVHYKPSWHNPFFSETSGKSLERLNPGFPSNARANWTTSPDRSYGGSPGKQNSAYLQSPKAEQTSGISISPNPFSPNSDGHNDHTLISVKLSDPVNRLRAKVFDARGRLIATLENGRPTATEASVIWDGRTKDGKIAPIGIYIILVEAFSANTKSEVFKKPVVLAQPLN
jgi:hypothetical protein